MKNKIINISLLLLLFISGSLRAQINLEQQVIGSAGGFHQVPGGNSYSYTVGETMVATQSNFSVALILTQGFQQTISNDSVTYGVINESCPGAANGSIFINNVPGCPGPYTVVVNTTADSITVNQDSLITGNYDVTITGPNGCFYSTQIFVGIDNTQACDVTSEILNESCPGAANGSIFITSVEGCSGPYSVVINTTTPDSSVVGQDTLSAGVYNVTITGSNGCIYTTQINVGLDSDEACDLKFYSGITPNGDGNNDTWIIDNIELSPENTVEIFNRWGNQVWVGEKYDNSTVVWKGLDKNGVEMTDATYFYVAVVNGQTYKGFIELTR